MVSSSRSSAPFQEWNDLATAREHLQVSEELVPMPVAQNPHRSRVAWARVRETEGELDDALEFLGEAERL